MTLKYIKADVEGVGLNVLKGAINTIKTELPVISIAIYHCYEEFFLIHEFMKQFPNYVWEFHSENPYSGSLYELSAFFYPSELIYPNYLII